MKRSLSSIALLCVAYSPASNALEWRGNISSELSIFPKPSIGVDNYQGNNAIAAEVELSHDVSDTSSIGIHPFVRVGAADKSRTSFDLREFMLSKYGDSWEINAGIGSVFWGVTESRNPANIINQTDLAEGQGVADKLGQPMLNFNWYTDLGDIEAYILPLFRERTFLGEKGRPYSGIVVNSDVVSYESELGDQHMDFALRWSKSFDNWDFAIHAFSGTSREPVLQLNVGTEGPELRPYYNLMDQAGLEAVRLIGDLSLKAEVVQRRGEQFEPYTQAVSGMDYNWVGALSFLQDNNIVPDQWCGFEVKNPLKRLVCNDRMDIRIISEYLWDERGIEGPDGFQNDVLTAVNFNFNDTAASEFIVGLMKDLDGGASILTMEASTRINNSYRFQLESREYIETDEDPFFQNFKNESYYQVELQYFF